MSVALSYDGVPESSAPMRVGLAASVVLHSLVVAALLWFHPGSRMQQPPVFRFQLIAAPAGPRAVGVVQPPPVTQPLAPVPKAAAVVPKATKSTSTKTKPQSAPPKQATTSVPVPETAPPPKAVAPTAGGGPIGGKGADVKTIETPGIAFPNQAYLNNIVNQVLARFPPQTGSLTATVSFTIRRNGTVDPETIRLVKSSASYEFNGDVKSAVESAANRKAFGPLPAEFTDDVLLVFLVFDPKFYKP